MTPVHPGEILAETLAERRMSQTEFARRTGLTPKHINRIIRGKAGYSADVALRFERVLGVSANLWLGLWANYQTDLLRARP
jgi:HTH-type transcriptional regulator/antitoxin HigA